MRQLEPGFATAEWGFALGSAFWGTGMFVDGAEMVVDFAIETLGVRRLEARAAVANGRGNGALRKLGAVQEGVLRRSFLKNGQFLDQMLWSILSEEWRQAKAALGPRHRPLEPRLRSQHAKSAQQNCALATNCCAGVSYAGSACTSTERPLKYLMSRRKTIALLESLCNRSGTTGGRLPCRSS